MLSHGHHTRASFCENLQEKSRKPYGAPSGHTVWGRTGPSTGTAVVCKPAKSKCMVDIWQKPRAVLCKNFQENVTPKTAATVLRKPAQSKCTWTCRKSHFIRKFSSTMPQTKIKEISRGRLFARVCAVKMRMEMLQEPVFIREFAGKRSHPETGKTVFASLHSRNAHGHVRILCENSQVNCRRPRSRMAHVADFVRACTVEMHTRAHKRLAQIPLDMQTVRRATLCENFQVKCRRPISSKPRGADFARACAVEMHMDIAQEPVYARIYRKEAGS